MKDQLQEILDSLDEKTPRSRLSPYRNLIVELRRRKRTYREILQILREKCQVQVSISTLHGFLIAQRKQKRIVRTSTISEHPKPREEESMPERIPIPAASEKPVPAPPPDEVRQRIAALKQQPAQTEPDTKRFYYDPDQPLHLIPNGEKI